MRLRNKNWTVNYIAEHQDLMLNFVDDQQIILKDAFQNKNHDYALEIGCGKGQFILNQALKNPEINYIGMEKERTVIGVALKKAVETAPEIKNLKFLNSFAEDLTKIFPSKSFQTIYLNFSDPWPKAKHFKKRLTYQTFLNQYHDILVDNGIIEIKTDNKNLYQFSLEQIQQNGKFTILFQTDDLYAQVENLQENIATEYEMKFHQLSEKIHKIVLKKSK